MTTKHEWENELYGYDIQHIQILPQETTIGEEFSTQVWKNKKEYTVTLPKLKFKTIDGDFVEFKPNSYGVPAFSWLFNDSKYNGSTAQQTYTWGAFSSFCSNAYDPSNWNMAKEYIERLAQLIVNAAKVSGTKEMWLHTYKGNVAGATRTYNIDILNQDILDVIYENGFGDSLKSVYSIYASNEKHVNFVLRLKGLSRVSLVIRNGYNGDTALTYHIAIWNHNNNLPIHVSKPISRNLHRGLLENTFNNLVDQLSEIRTQEVLARIENSIGINFMMRLHTIVADELEQVKTMRLKRGDPRAILKKIPTGEKSLSKIQDTFNYVFSDVRDKSGLTLLDELLEVGRLNRCVTSIDLLINYLFAQELITEEFLSALSGD